jgi:asparagine synthase (glutamine-hydrolysing)
MLRDLSQSSLDSLVRRGLVREPFARDLLGRRIHEHPGYYGEVVWVLVMLDQWLASHRSRAPSRPVAPLTV